MPPWTSPSWARRPPSPAASSCSRRGRPGSSSTAGCSRAARTRRSATASPWATSRRTVDAILLTHAHLDHCGLIPLVVRAGVPGPDPGDGRHDRAGPPGPDGLGPAPGGVRQARRRGSSAGTPRRRRPRMRATCGRPARRSRSPRPATRARRPIAASAPAASRPSASRPPRVVDDCARRARASAGEATCGPPRTPGRPARARRRAAPRTRASIAGAGAARLRPRGRRSAPSRPTLETDLDEPLYTEDDAIEALRHFRPIRYGAEEEVAPGIHATYLDAGHILGSAIIRLRVADRAGRHRSGSSSSRATSASATRRSSATRPR